MTYHPDIGRDKGTPEGLVAIGLMKPAMACTASETVSSSDSDDESCYAAEMTMSEERLFREMAALEYQSEDDQFEESRRRSRDKASKDEGSLDEEHQTREEDQAQEKTQLSLVDDEMSAFLSHCLPDFDGENEKDLDSKKASEVSDFACLKESGLQTKPTKRRSWEFLTSSSKKTKRKSMLYICLTCCKYDSVHRVAKMFGFKEVFEYEDWNLFWTDGCVTLSRMMDMKKFQKVNHFPGMSEICRKDLLARNMNRMLKSFPKEYNIFPRTWCLPADYADFQLHARRRKHRTYIVKPESSCQGRGIWLTRKTKQVSPVERLICQVYISKPLLIDRLKFDFRIYVVVTSVDPFRIYVFKDGLARFATAKYVEPTKHNVENIFMHLTNYAINKAHYHYSVDDEAGNKRRISTVIRWLERNHGDVKRLWADIDDIIIKTLISAHSTLRQNYRSCFLNHDQITACFDILGFDILLDQKLKPYLLEVNHSPSFHTDTDLDRDIKETLLYDTLCLVNFDTVDRRQCIEEEKRRIMTRLTTAKKSTDPNSSRDNSEKLQEKFNDEQLRYEETHLGNFRRIYPLDGTDRYNKFFCTSSSVYQETASFRAHTNCARLQREQIMRRKEELDILQKKKKDPSVRPESPDVKKAKPRQTIPEIASPAKVPTPLAMPKTYYPETIIAKDEMNRINDLIDREVLINAVGMVQFVRDMFSQSVEITPTVVDAPPTVVDAPPTTSEVQETLKPNDVMDERVVGTSCEVAASGAAAEAGPVDISDAADRGTAVDQSVELEPAPAGVCAQPSPPPPPIPPPSQSPPSHSLPSHPLPSPSRCSSAFDRVPASQRSLSTPSQSMEEKSGSGSSSKTLPCGPCVLATSTCDAPRARTPRPQFPGMIAYPQYRVSRSLNPLLRHVPPQVRGGGSSSTGCTRYYERMLAQIPNQRELGMMLSMCRNPSSQQSSVWNWPEMKLGLTKSQTLADASSAAAAEETGLEEKARPNRRTLTYQQRKQHRVGTKLRDEPLEDNKWLEISKVDLHKQFKPSGV